MKDVAKKFQPPLVIFSVSLDTDEAKCEEFVVKKEMSWPQYRDGGFAGSIARLFGVNAIPPTFTIDAYRVLQEEHVGDGPMLGHTSSCSSQDSGSRTLTFFEASSRNRLSLSMVPGGAGRRRTPREPRRSQNREKNVTPRISRRCG